MNHKQHVAFLVIGCVVVVATAAAGQHRWKKTPDSSSVVRPLTVRPRASIGGAANGIYCPDMVDDAIGVHDLGWVPAGLNVTVTVESFVDNAFDPVAAVLVASLGEKAANNIKTTTFYDNDSGGDKDASISFVAPQQGTYLLLVSDFSGKTPGCYRYQATIG
jgi:hypothetical protein